MKQMSEQLAQQIIRSCGAENDPYEYVKTEDLALQLRWFAEAIIEVARSKPE